MYRHRQRLGKNHHLLVAVGVERNALRAINHLVLGKSAVNMWEVHRAAEKAHLSTLVLLIRQAILTLPAGLAGV
ncbi:hypothetical protein D3C71_1730360 [compost metagenome]